jgi:L-rhamnose-H+ transport protein
VRPVKLLDPVDHFPKVAGHFGLGAFALCGMSAAYLGSLGIDIGWSLFQIFMIMTATLSGVWTGEWKHAPRQAILLLSSGIAGLTGATVLPALGNR